MLIQLSSAQSLDHPLEDGAAVGVDVSGLTDREDELSPRQAERAVLSAFEPTSIASTFEDVWVMK